MLELADLTFTTLVLTEPYGAGIKLFHHQDLSEKRGESLPRQHKWEFCAYNGTVHVLDNDEHDGIGDGIGERMATLKLCGHGH